MCKLPISRPQQVLTVALVHLFIASTLSAQAASPIESARGIIERLVPAKASQFVLETIPADADRDVFELESRDGKIVVRGSSGVAIASGWNWYLNHFAHCHVSLWGNNLTLPEILPTVPEKVRRVSPWKHRYYLNFCVFSYNLAWWDWPQWERLIDWMALHGINMPLSVTGQEAIWQKVYRDLGLSDQELNAFFVGPAFLPFGWMGCIDAWGGPLPNRWIDSHLELQKKIIARERELGMTPVLQGFTGHVPSALAKRFPQVKMQQLPSWCGFPPTYFLSPQDPMFAEIGKRFIEEQTRQFGTDHLYASDTFIEMPPPSNDPAFLASMGKAVFAAMQAGDPQAKWVMQGWIFVNAPKFWEKPQAKALLDAVPDDRMILLDLACENVPVWNKTEAFYGKPWIWNIVQDYGDVVSLHGGLPQLAANLHEAMTSPQRGKLAGIGLVNEGLGYNPVINQFLGEMAWRNEVPAIPEWIRDYVLARNGALPSAAEKAWQQLLATAYRSPARLDSAICDRPNLIDSKAAHEANLVGYGNDQLAKAWEHLLACAPELSHVDTYRFDLAHVSRQVLSNHAARLRHQIFLAYEQKDRRTLAKRSDQYLQLIRDLDSLLATRNEFLLGRWLSDAKRWATDDNERKLYQWNARTLITLWGPRDGCLHEYSRREWSGMLTGFYLPRWKMFFESLDRSLAEGKPLDTEGFQRTVRDWEDQWTHQTDVYPTEAHGDTVAISRQLWKKYGKFVSQK